MCWGSNSHGQLGDGTTTPRATPVAVQGLSGVTSIDLGYARSYAVRHDGTVWAWGMNYYGSLGNGVEDKAAPTAHPTPTQVVGLNTAIQVSCFKWSTWGAVCALQVGGTSRCWGSVGYGQFGEGTTGTTSVRPAPTQATALSGIVTLSLGVMHTCALRSDGTAWCWGYNDRGQVGTGAPITNAFSMFAWPQAVVAFP